jgi:hypothetical protein
MDFAFIVRQKEDVTFGRLKDKTTVEVGNLIEKHSIRLDK